MILERKTFDYQNRVLIEKVTIKPPFRFEALFQDEGCFLYITGQETNFQTAVQTTHIRSREAVLLKCGKYFVDWLEHYAGNEKIEAIAVHLYPEMLRKLYDHDLPKTIKQRSSNERITHIVPDNMLGRFIENLFFYFENPALVNDDLLELKIKELILLLIQSKNANSVLQLLEELFTPRTATLREVINTHLYADLSMEEQAEMCHLSLSSFKREFRKVFNDSPMNYMIGRKLRKASNLLEVSDKSIRNIAFETGFNDPAYFSRCFKNKFGLSPSAYRDQRE